MRTTDHHAVKLINLLVSKVSFSSLKIMRRYLGDDLQLALIVFAVVLRTRRDLFQVVQHHGLNEDTISQIASEPGFYTSTNEVSKYTELSRATVTRKMVKLVELGILVRVEADKWHLKDFDNCEQTPASMMLFELLQNYLVMTDKLKILLPEVMVPPMRLSLDDLGSIEAKALSDEDVGKKRKRGLEVKH